MTKNKFTAFMFARGGSKGIPYKNVTPVASKPLLAHGIASALASPSISRLIVSTDDPRIAEAARHYGADVLSRPTELATDTAAEVLAWRHAIDSFPELFSENPQPFISLPATAPLRSPEDVEAALARFAKGDCDIVFSITRSRQNPYFSMVTINDRGLIEIAVRGAAPVRRQDAPTTYDITPCVYVASPRHVRNCARLIDGRAGYILVPPERALDIDEPFDLYLAELMLTHPYRKKN